eukprot:203980_1
MHLPLKDDDEDSDGNSEDEDILNTKEHIKQCEHKYIVAIHMNYNLLRLVTKEHGSDWIKHFIEERSYEITVHALCVLHHLSEGNVYHGRVILEVLLNHFPRHISQYLVEDSRVIQPLLQYVILNNIHHEDLNSFVMDLIYFNPEAIRQRNDIMFHHQKQKMTEYKSHLLQKVFVNKWKLIESVMKRACSKYCDNVSTKYSAFFVDLVGRSVSIEETKCLLTSQLDRIINSFVKGLLEVKDGKKCKFWQRIQYGQFIVEHLDLASRPTLIDPSLAATFRFIQEQNDNGEESVCERIVFKDEICCNLRSEQILNINVANDAQQLSVPFGHLKRFARPRMLRALSSNNPMTRMMDLKHWNNKLSELADNNSTE